VLVTPNTGIAVGMASSICSFNLAEICDATIALLKNPKLNVDRLLDILKAPDFPGGGAIIYNREEMRQVYETGSGSIPIRSRYNYDKEENCIEITQIPYSTTIEVILKKIADLITKKKEETMEATSIGEDSMDEGVIEITIDIEDCDNVAENNTNNTNETETDNEQPN
jgi:DNA gyrase subunit A